MKTLSAVLLPALLLAGGMWMTLSAQDEKPEVLPAPLPGQISEPELGEILATIGLKPTKTEQRYDFAFKTSYRGEEWKFSMSAVLSRNGQSVWVMAWLDQIPQTSAEVPRTALLRLLAANDRMGEGKFFAYIPNNKRFVLQRVVANRDMNNKKVMELLQDLAASVADEYPNWSVTNWTPKSDQQVVEDDGGGRNVPQNPTAASRSGAPANVKTSEAGTKFDGKSVN
ncbi:MAG: hypothetical protein O2856_06390 [Planctomycetota bacterium]|nr:hypothetical protein [Planctomycetota bacterium]